MISARFHPRSMLRRALSCAAIAVIACMFATVHPQPAPAPIEVHACAVLSAERNDATAARLATPPQMDTARIQTALSRCLPGQSVVLQANGAQDAFLAAPLILPRGVTLFLDRGVTLYASRNPRDYDLAPHSCGEPAQPHDQPDCKPFLFSYQAAYSGVLGPGAIDGQGGRAPQASSSWWERLDYAQSHRAHVEVPALISSYESQNFIVRGVHLRNAPGTSLAIYKTISLALEDVSILSASTVAASPGLLLSNSPGAHITSLSTHIPGAAIDLRASILGGTSRVAISGLHVTGGTGISIGDDVYGNTSAIQIQHASITDASRGFLFNLRGEKGGHLHDIRLQDVCLTRVNEPLAVEQQDGPMRSQLPDAATVQMDNVFVAGEGRLQPQGLQPDNSATCVPSSEAPQPHLQWALDRSHLPHPGTQTQLTVAPDGSAAFHSLAEAIGQLPDTGGSIAVQPGIYREVVTIRKPHVRIYGLDPDPAKTVLVFSNTGPKSAGTFNSATVFVEADNVSIDNLTIANDAGTGKGQAVALAVTADRAAFHHLRLLGAQDTLFAAARYCYGDYGPCVPTRQYFRDSTIAGNTDFIFGDSQAVFDRCTLHGIPGREVMYTAQGRHYAAQQSGYVFDHCTLTADPGDARITLGRPWRPHATVVYLNTRIDAPVIPAGWTEWPRFGQPSLSTAFFAEFHSTGPGASPATREPYSHQLTPAQAERWNPRHFLAGHDGWDPIAGK
ncbi:MAG: pectinesterase family protein [Terracidiphilus sp.]